MVSEKGLKWSRNNRCRMRQEQKGVGIGSEEQSSTASWSKNRGCMRKQEQEGIEKGGVGERMKME